jgi:hypothetical protein
MRGWSVVGILQREQRGVRPRERGGHDDLGLWGRLKTLDLVWRKNSRWPGGGNGVKQARCGLLNAALCAEERTVDETSSTTRRYVVNPHPPYEHAFSKRTS